MISSELWCLVPITYTWPFIFHIKSSKTEFKKFLHRSTHISSTCSHMWLMAITLCSTKRVVFSSQKVLENHALTFCRFSSHIQGYAAFWINFCMWHKVKVNIFCLWLVNCCNITFEKILFSLLNCFGIFVKSHLTMHMLSTIGLCSDSLICCSIFLPTLHSLAYYLFISLENRQCKSYLFSKIVSALLCLFLKYKI